MTTTNQTEAGDIHYTVIDRDNGERYSTTSSTSRDRAERERNRIALTDGKLVCLGIGRISPDGTIEDVTALTADTITDDEIMELREVARETGDTETYDLCQFALGIASVDICGLTEHGARGRAAALINARGVR